MPLPITAGVDYGTTRLWLRVLYRLCLDDENEYMAIDKSALGLMVEMSPGKPPRPFIRLEYERRRGTEPEDHTPGRHTRAAAHVQIHGSSTEFGTIQGLRGLATVRDLDRLHIPVGGRRYRPTLEDFIEFLVLHDLINVHDGWEAVLAQHRQEWLRHQLQAAVRDDPTSAVEQLRRMSYSVEPPT